ncbi:MAG: response regulator [Gemmatimonadota bacterium]
MTRDDLALRLLSMFTIELEDQTQAMAADILALEQSPEDVELLKRLFRGAHTLKGAAHAAGVPLAERACHALESRLMDVRDGRSRLAPPDFALLLETVDALADAGRRLASQQTLDDSPLARLTNAVPAPRRSGGPATAPPAAAAPPVPAVPAPADSGPAHVRIDPRKFDALLASAGEVVTTSHRITARRETAAELQGLVARIRTRLPARSSSATAGLNAPRAAGQLAGLLTLATRLATETLEDARVLTHASENLSASTRALRMRPFLDACEGLPRTVRDLAAATHRQARLEMVCADTEVDRLVLDRLRPAIVHLIRNAVAHGIEPADVRIRNGKVSVGTVRVSAEQAGDRLIMTVADDGAGLDLDALRERFGAAAPEDEGELARLVFEPGLSTRTQVSEIAGRGVGLDAARDAVESIRGRIEVVSKAGVGTTFTIETPLTLSLLSVVVVETAGEILALPARAIVSLLRVPVDDVGRLDGRDVLSTPGGPVPLVGLAAMLGLAGAAEPMRHAIYAILLDTGGQRLAVAVDRLLVDEEVLMRPLTRIQTGLPLVLGGAIHGDGEPILILDPDALIRAGLEGTSGELSLARSVDAAPVARILVADDSITTRTLLQAILHGAGHDVKAAPDGGAALELLRNEPFDLLVSDVEMPVMSGFELCQEVRRSPALAHLPIILVTALETADQRARGFEAGADAYLGKSSFDQQVLLERVRQLLR